MQIDLNNVYSGTYPLGGGVSGPWAGQALTAGTTLSTNAIDHNPAQTPFGLNQNVQAGIGEPQAIVLEVINTVGHTGTETYTVNLLTDINANLTTTPLTLGTLTIPNTTVAGTYFVTVLPPTLTFLRYSGLQYVLVNGGGTATLNVAAYLVPVNFVQNWAAGTYQSGFVLQNS